MRLHQPLLDAFTKESGIKVNTLFVKDSLLERVRAEGDKSPADVLMKVDIGNLLDLVDGGVNQAIKSETLESVIPANLRGADDK
jgi:iron(III) transport system substrate-binding protein